jgi:hypothetical protein
MVWLLAFFLTLVGFVFGIAALFGIRRHGTKGILLPALIGIILNGLIIVMFITMIASAFSRARPRQKAEVSGVILVWASTRPGSVYFWQPTDRTRGSAQPIEPPRNAEVAMCPPSNTSFGFWL